MICGRCQKPIRGDEEHTTYVPDSGTGAAPTVYLHAELCPQPPTQPAPISLRH
ncbi:hypothetical protein [Streptomyces adelaidensis]|jgi:hypothetical protein|uniref:hypothetical protein n=1 Tax=Streptomyces adelaidensis TaxID=2796465 RepID=UPI0019049D55|nr:hypothetical protein [Streptomyces adelaidensis]